MRLSFSIGGIAASLVVAFSLLMAGPALATTTLSAVAIATAAGGGAHVTVTLGGTPPKYTLSGVGTSETVVLFSDAKLAPGVAPTVPGKGPVQAITLSQVGPNVAVALHLVSAVPVHVVAGQPFAIEVQAAGPSDSEDDEDTTPAVASGPSALSGHVTEVIPLKYADISEVAGVLVQGSNVASNDNFNPQSSNFGSESFGGETGGVGQGFQSPQFQGQTFGGQFNGGEGGQGLAQRVSDNVAVDRRLNAIVLSGTPDVVASLKAMIDKLDVPLDSVMLDTQIVELDETGAEDLGVDFNAAGVYVQATYTVQSLQFPTGSATFQANLYALITKGEGHILAKPRILAQSGSSASILTGDALPIITTVVIAGASAVTSQQVNYVNVGVNLQVLPRVASDGYVTTHIFSQVSSVTAYTQGIPQISQRQATTTATVKDGESFIIGGLLADNEIKTVYKIPGLGDIPLIGGLFNRVSSTLQRTNLYVVVTPQIIHYRPTADTTEPGAAPATTPGTAPEATPVPGAGTGNSG